eukprot:6180691-Pleurochrysis_carterae.AAC.4
MPLPGILRPFQVLGRQISAHLPVYEPVYFSRASWSLVGVQLVSDVMTNNNKQFSYSYSCFCSVPYRYNVGLLRALAVPGCRAPPRIGTAHW